MVAFCHLLLALLPAPLQEEAAAVSEPAVELADPEEIAALEALRAMEATLDAPPTAPDEDALAAWTEKRVDAYMAITMSHQGRLAAAEAWHAIGLLRLHSQSESASALAAMAEAWEILRGFEGPKPRLARLSAAGYGDYLLAAQLDLEDLDAAAKLLAELRERIGPVVEGPQESATRARHARLDLEEARLLALRRLQPGLVFPNFTVERLDGTGMISVADLRGAPALIEFHATWCGPSFGIPRTAATATQESSLGVLTVFLDEDRELAALRALERGHEDPRLGWAPGGLQGEFARGFALRSLPRSFLLDANGVILERNLRGADLLRAIAKQMGAESAQTAKD